jgi:hypothetical protein
MRLLQVKIQALGTSLEAKMDAYLHCNLLDFNEKIFWIEKSILLTGAKGRKPSRAKLSWQT